MTSGVRVVVAGHRGRMGRRITQRIEQASDMELVGTVGRDDDLLTVLSNSSADVLVDVTGPESVLQHGLVSVGAGVSPLLGASGLDAPGVDRLRRACSEAELGGLWVPNFSLASVLLQRFAEQAAAHFADVEIVEAHHRGKLDAPSGTALHTADRIAAVRTGKVVVPGEGEPSRGQVRDGVPIHALRLSGVVADQEVRFGGEGETLSLRHTSTDRSSFMPGVLQAVRGVRSLSSFQVGLDAVLGIDASLRPPG